MALPPAIPLNFISDRSASETVRSFYEQGRACHEHGGWLGAMACYGGVAEGLLTWAAHTWCPDELARYAKREAIGTGDVVGVAIFEVRRLSLGPLADKAVEWGILSPRAQNAVRVVQHFRNLIHPYNARRSSTTPNESAAHEAHAMLQAVVESLRYKLKLADVEEPGAGIALPTPQALNFSWVLPRMLAGASGPSCRDDLHALRSAGIDLLVRLAEDPYLSKHDVESTDLEDAWVPISDFTAPTDEQIRTVTSASLRAIRARKATAITCGAGRGRTGTMLSCVLLALGYPLRDAFQLLFASGRQPFETPEQCETIARWARRP